jgi:hypothetical protein
LGWENRLVGGYSLFANRESSGIGFHLSPAGDWWPIAVRGDTGTIQALSGVRPMGYIPAMLVALALAGVAGWFLGKRLSPWWKWLVAAFAGGAAIAFAVALTQGLLGWMAPGQAVVRGIATAPMAGIVAVFVAWIASRRC